MLQGHIQFPWVAQDIRIGVVGKIVQGKSKGLYLEILDDSENTGGYLLTTAVHRDRERARWGETWDDWVETRQDLEAVFEEVGWVVDWLF